MVSPSFTPRSNQLLKTLPSVEYRRLLRRLEVVDLAFPQKLYSPNQPITHVYFPLNAVCSLLTLLSDGTTIEVGTVGNEGLVGLPVFLEATQAPGEAICQVAGRALRLPTKTFKQEVTPDMVLFKIILRYTQALLSQIAQSTACNRAHSIEARFCRWILMTHGRVDSEQFVLTQEFIGSMLGVRRASVSEVASKIQRDGLIQYRRGHMTILDRPGLESAACECYSVIKAEFDRLISEPLHRRLS